MLEEDGCVVVTKLVPSELVNACRKAVEDRVCRVCRLYGIAPEEDFHGLLSVRSWDKTPADWDGPRFGPRKNRGWMPKLGSGKMFDDWGNPECMAMRESLREFIAALHGVHAASLQLIPDRVSLKCTGCDALPLHVDRNRIGSYQVVVALSECTFITVPGSHKNSYGSKAGYYELNPEELQGLEIEEEDANAGDVLVMVGGKCVHGSPAIVEAGKYRVALYVHFATAG